MSSTMKRAFFAGGALVALLSLSAEARADGLAVGSSRIAPASRTKLAEDIAAFKSAEPGVRAKVRDVQSVKPEVYGKFQNPKPEASRELRRLGKDALVPMLEALAFDASQPGLAAHEREALKLGMIEAVGYLKDSRSVPVLTAIFADEAEQTATALAAATALGMVCDTAAVQLLERKAFDGSKTRLAALSGLGQCRSVQTANTLASALRGAQDDATRQVIIQALGTLGSSWAWAALGKDNADTGAKVRVQACDVLIETFVAAPARRAESKRAILKCEASNAIARIQAAKRGQNADTVKALEDLEKKLNKAAARAK